MRRSIRFIAASACLLLFPALALAGPDGYSEYDWREIRPVKGGAGSCAVAAKGDDMLPVTTVFFDGQGRVTRLRIGSGATDIVYDEAGRVLEVRTGFFDESGRFSLESRAVYAYDESGRLVSISRRDSSGKEVVKETGVAYDGKGNVKIERLTLEGGVSRVETYDKNGRIVEERMYTDDSSAPGASKKEVFAITAWRYDKNGNLIRKDFDYPQPPIPGMPKKITQTFAYRFDARGNPTEQTVTITPKGGPLLPDLYRPSLVFSYAASAADADQPAGEGVAQKVRVEWNGEWYPAEILKQEGDKYLIHYDGYASSWDEWVTKDRIKF